MGAGVAGSGLTAPCRTAISFALAIFKAYDVTPFVGARLPVQVAEQMARESRDMKRKAREGKHQSWPYQREVGFITMSLNSVVAGIAEAPSAPTAKTR